MNKVKISVIGLCTSTIVIMLSLVFFGSGQSNSRQNTAEYTFQDYVNVVNTEVQEEIFNDLVVVDDDYDNSRFDKLSKSKIRFSPLNETDENTDEEEVPDNLCELEEFECIKFVVSPGNPLYDYGEDDVIVFLGQNDEKRSITVESVSRDNDTGEKLFEARYSLADEVYKEIDYFNDMNDEYEKMAKQLAESENVISAAPGTDGDLTIMARYYDSEHKVYYEIKFVIYDSSAELKLCTNWFDVTLGSSCTGYTSTYFVAKVEFDFGFEFKAERIGTSPIESDGIKYDFSIGISVAGGSAGTTAYFETLEDFQKYFRWSNFSNPILQGLDNAEGDSSEKSLFTKRFVTPLGITIHVDLLAGFDFDVVGSVGVEHAVRYNVTVGAEFDDVYKPLNNAVEVATKTGIYAEGSVNADAYVYARFGIGYLSKTPYVAAGPRVGIEAEALGRAETYVSMLNGDVDLNYCIQAGLEANVYVDMVGEAKLRLNLWIYKKTLIDVDIRVRLAEYNVVDYQVPIGSVLPGSDVCIIVDNMYTADNLIEAIQANPGGNFYLSGDITFTSSQLKELSEINFKGTLNGNGYKITHSNDISTRNAESIYYLFEEIGSDAIVSNLWIVSDSPISITKVNHGSIVNSKIELNIESSISNYAPVADVNNGNIRNISISGSISGENNISGVVLYNSSSGSIFNSNIDISIYGNNNISGLVKVNEGTIAGNTLNLNLSGNTGIYGMTANNIGEVLQNDIIGLYVEGNNSSAGFIGSNSGKLENLTINGNIQVYIENAESFLVSSNTGDIKHIDIDFITYDESSFSSIVDYNYGVIYNISYIIGDTSNYSGNSLIAVTNDGTISKIELDININAIDDFAAIAVTNNNIITGITGNITINSTNQIASIAILNTGLIDDVELTIDLTTTVNVAGIAIENSGTISNIELDASLSGGSYISGIANNISSNAVIENVVFNGTIDGDDYVAGVSYNNYGRIENVEINAGISGNDYVAGVVSVNDGLVSNAHYSGTIVASNYVGGIVGENRLSIDNVSVDADIYGYNYVGGITGANEFTINNASFSGYIEGYDYIGGIVGSNAANVTNVSAIGSIKSNGIIASKTGGLIGDNSGTLSIGYANMDITAPNAQIESYIGGLIGNNSGNASNLISAGSVSSTLNCGPTFGTNSGSYSNIYYLDSHELVSGNSSIYGSQLNASNLNSEFLTSIGFDEEIWDLTNVMESLIA